MFLARLILASRTRATNQIFGIEVFRLHKYKHTHTLRQWHIVMKRDGYLDRRTTCFFSSEIRLFAFVLNKYVFFFKNEVLNHSTNTSYTRIITKTSHCISTEFKRFHWIKIVNNVNSCRLTSRVCCSIRFSYPSILWHRFVSSLSIAQQPINTTIKQKQQKGENARK